MLTTLRAAFTGIFAKHRVRRRRSRNGVLATSIPALEEQLEPRRLMSATPVNALSPIGAPADVISFDPTGGSVNPSIPPGTFPKNTVYLNGTAAATLPSGWTVTRTIVGDFAGDSKMDIAVQTGNDWYIGTRSGSTFLFNTSAPSGSTPGGTGNTDFIVGNFHGSAYTPSGLAKEDIAFRDSTGNWMILPSTGLGGTSGFSTVVNSGAAWLKSQSWEQFQKLDVNGDGLDEIVGITTPGTQLSSSTQIFVLQATGTGFVNTNFTAPNARTNYMGFTMNTGVNAIRVGDFNRDGKDDIAAWNQYANNMGGQNKIWVGLSTGTSFDWNLPTNVLEPGTGGDMPWGTIGAFLINDGLPQVGDFNGDVVNPLIRDDFVYFSGTGTRTIMALMSNGVDGFNRPVGTTTVGSGAAYNAGTVSITPITPAYLMVTDLNNDGADDLWEGDTNATAFKILSVPASPPVGSGLTSGFTFSRASSSYMNWSVYPLTYRFWNIGFKYA